MNFCENTIYWAFLISVGSYILGVILQRKTKCFIFNPLLLSTILTIIFLVIFQIEYEEFYDNIDFLNYFLSPATVCLAIPLYVQIEKLKKNLKAVICGIISGVLASLSSILLFSYLFKFNHTLYITILPKSITAAIAMGISEEMGGVPSLTVPIVIITGIIGNITAEKVCKLFKITEPIAKGVAIGSASHVMGTTKAMEMGEIEGAMSSISVVVSGIITVIGVAFFANLY